MLAYQCKPLRKIDQEIRDIVAEMFELMYANSGVGLAANQVNIPYQIVVINPTGDKSQKDSEYVFINPTILKLKGENENSEEGCLSFPGLRMIVPRAKEIKFQAVDINGQVQTYSWKGFNARIVQHETDHLHGVCFFQRAVASITPNYELFLARMKERFIQDQESGVEMTQEMFEKHIEELEKMRT